MTTIGVVLTARNEELHLQACLEGLRRQERLPDAVILVDDGSSDRTGSIMRAFAAGSPFPTTVVDSGGIGRAPALNLALTHLDTDIAAVQDADDISRPVRMREHLAAFDSDESLGWHSGQVRFIDTEGRGSALSSYPVDDRSIHAMLRRKKMPVAHCASAYRLSLAKTGLWYDPMMKRGQDFNLLLRRGDEIKFSTTNTVLVDYRSEGSDLSWSHWRFYRAQHYYAIERAERGAAVPPLDAWLISRPVAQRLRQLDAHEWVYGRLHRAFAQRTS